MNLRAIDLNLLVVFDALMRERHVTRAAQSINLSQPAFSNALTRLRERLGDELFIRSPEGMQPTPWALELSGPISTALSGIENALDGATFDPATSKRTFTIATLDYATITLFPQLLSRLRKEAPGLVLQTINPSLYAGEYLDTQQADLALLSWSDPPERFTSEPMLREDWVCVLRPEHPLAREPLTLETYTQAEHLLVSPLGEQRGWVDESLTELGKSRHVAFSMPTFGPAPLMLETTDLVLTCPGSVGHVFGNLTGMTVTRCPIEAPLSRRSVDMIWHSRVSNHPAQKWLRQVLREIGTAAATSAAYR